MTIARWYGGHAAVPSVAHLVDEELLEQFALASGAPSSPGTGTLLFAEPPPLVTKRNLYSSPSAREEVDLRGQVVAGVLLVRTSSAALVCE
jgi:hypothetical protein